MIKVTSGKISLEVLETHSSGYLGKNDIIRFEGSYERSKTS
jgi:hypothetical protein